MPTQQEMCQLLRQLQSNHTTEREYEVQNRVCPVPESISFTLEFKPGRSTIHQILEVRQ